MDFLLTTTQASIFLQKINTLISGYKKGSSFNDFLEQGLRPEELKYVQKTFNELNLDMNYNDFSKVITKIEESFLALPVVNVTLAFEPKRESILRMHDQISNTVSKKFLLKIAQNPSIIGGVVIEFAGLHKDYSLQNKLNGTK